MRLKEKTFQSRRDFYGTYVCEFCGNVETKIRGYDDRNFHDTVVPNIKCKKCGKSTISEGGEIDQVITKYDESQIV